MIFLSVALLRHAIKEVVAHVHLERNLCLGNRLLKSGAAANCDGTFIATSVLVGC